MKRKHKRHAKKSKQIKKENKLVLALIIIVLFLIAIRIIGKYGSSDEKLQEDAEKLLNAITTDLKIVDSDYVDEKAVQEIMKKDYISLKEQLGLKNDFCIYFEDSDGNLIKINGMGTGIGSGKVKVNGVSCG